MSATGIPQAMKRWEATGRTDRRFRAYCVGSAKSGTHSIAAIFDRDYAAAHEPEHKPMIETILARDAGNLSDRQIARFLTDRDRRLALEMDSSQLNGHVIADLVALFPLARFVLTIRDVYSFVNSAIDHHIARAGGSETWRRMNQLKFGGCPHCPHDAPLADRGLFPLQGYLTYWTRHNQTILDVVPPDRLLPVGTNDISGSLPQIARFLGIECETLDASRSHQYPAVEKLNILGRLDPDYLEDRVNVHCAPLMTRFFPDVRCARP